MHRRATRDAEDARDAPARVAAHLDRPVADDDVGDPGPGAAVEAPGAERRQHRVGRPLGPHPGPGEVGVEPRVVAVVGREREAGAAGVEQLVPVHRREAAPDLELAAAVVDLDPRDGLGKLERAGCRAGPVGMGEVRDAAVADDPGGGASEIEAVPLELVERVVDAEREHVAVPPVRQDAVQLGARQHEEALRRRRVAAMPVVGDREHVVPGPLVVLDEHSWWQLAVGVGRVGVQGAAQPRPRAAPGIGHRVSLHVAAILKR